MLKRGYIFGLSASGELRSSDRVAMNAG